MAGKVWFGLMGSLETRVADRPVPVPPRVRSLLAILLCRSNRTVGVDELAEILWNGEPPRGASGTVRSHVLRLRRLLGEAGDRVGTSRSGYKIHLDPCSELDIMVFTELHEAARTAARNRDWPQVSRNTNAALELWRGAPLADVACDRLHRDEVPGWIQARVEAVDLAAQADLRLGRTAEAVLALQRLAAENPYQESVHALLMEALVAAGRRVEAIAVYRRLRTVLVGELGIEPGAQAAAAHQRAIAAGALKVRAAGRARAEPGTAPVRTDRAGRPDADPHAGAAATSATPAAVHAAAAGDEVGVLHLLPAELPNFVGREAELDALLGGGGALRGGGALFGGGALHGRGTGSGCRPPSVGITVIEGMAGVGKTSLAVRVAHELVRAGRFADLQLYANLRSFDPHQDRAEPTDVLDGLLRVLGVDASRIPSRMDARAALFRDRLHGREALLLLDDALDEQQIRPLIPSGPGCLVLVTSRRSLAGLDCTTPLRLGTFSAPESLDLLDAVLGAERVGAEPEAAMRVADLCGHLPRALALAAYRLRTRPAWSLADLAGHLEDGGFAAGVGDRSLWAAFRSSYRNLPALPARVFRLLAAGRDRRVTAQWVAALAGLDVHTARAALELLVDEHLLLQNAPGRYRMHDLLYAFACELSELSELSDLSELSELSEREAGGFARASA
ncbi:AfsR/SARP family transcriptional regulator [Kitasatospora griseola]|uniref:AfsR/SARP family transcriptional regulator n=1 Tax=Kitasatospora griseola TaxID=2064 RepID=UPI003447E598